MLVHLGKTYLGQTDRLDLTSKGEALEQRVIILPDNGRDPEDESDRATARPTADIPEDEG